MSKQMNIPKLRFPEFKEDSENVYKRHSFNDIFLFSTGKNIKQNEASPEFETPCVRYGELYHMYNEVITEIINRTNFDKSELLFSDGDEILLPSAGEDPLDIGSASALTIKNVAIGRTINILKPAKANIYAQIYVAYYINQKLRITISTLAKGVSISNVYNSDLKTLKIMLPNLQEQQKVASFLTSIDAKLQALKKKKSLLEQYKKGVMQRIFLSEKVSELGLVGLEDERIENDEGKENPTIHKSYKSKFRQLRFKDENGKDFPEWEVKKLGEVLSIPQKIKPEIIDKEKLLTVKLHLKGVLKNESTEGLSIGSTNYYIRHKGQFIYGKQNLFNGAFGIIPEEFEGFLSSSDVPTLDINSQKSNSSFLFYHLSRESFYKKLEDIASGSGSKRIHEDTFLNVEVSFPSLPEQTRIANFLSTIDEKINHCQKQIEKTEAWKKGLLQKMFV